MIAFWLFVYTVMGKDAQRLLWVCPPNLHPPTPTSPSSPQIQVRTCWRLAEFFCLRTFSVQRNMLDPQRAEQGRSRQGAYEAIRRPAPHPSVGGFWGISPAGFRPPGPRTHLPLPPPHDTPWIASLINSTQGPNPFQALKCQSSHIAGRFSDLPGKLSH